MLKEFFEDGQWNESNDANQCNDKKGSFLRAVFGRPRRKKPRGARMKRGGGEAKAKRWNGNWKIGKKYSRTGGGHSTHFLCLCQGPIMNCQDVYVFSLLRYRA